MAKKKKKKASTKKKPKPEGSKGFGHLHIPDDVRVRDTGVVHEGDKNIDSLECWEGYEWDE